MSWSFYLGSLVFFSIVFAVFYAVAYSILLGIRDNYRRYYQKAELQWTNPVGQKKRRIPPLRILLSLSVLTSWFVVHFLIQPG